MRAFAPVRPPGRAAVRGISWLTWSPELRRLVDRHGRELRQLSTPRLVDVPGCEPYESTYDVPFSRIRSLSAHGDLLACANQLDLLQLDGSLLAFDRMIDGNIDSDMLYALFVALRACICHNGRSASRALCTPVKTEARDAGFPLHADLFKRQRLFIVFDDVSPTKGGESLFLSARKLFALLERLPACPARVRKRVETLLASRLRADGFDELYDLLHGANHAWVGELEGKIEQEQTVIRFTRGQGYLIHDRQWLHGRRASEVPVTARRFRRLVF